MLYDNNRLFCLVSNVLCIPDEEMVAEELEVSNITSTFLSISLERLTQTDIDIPSSASYKLLSNDTLITV